MFGYPLDICISLVHGGTHHKIKVVVQRSEAESCLAEFLIEKDCCHPWDRAKEYLQDLLNHHLIQMAFDEKIEYRHQLIQEYYASEYLLKLKQFKKISFQVCVINHIKWTPTLEFLASLVSDYGTAQNLLRSAFEVDQLLAGKLVGKLQKRFSKGIIDNFAQSNVDIPDLVKIELLNAYSSEFVLPYMKEHTNHSNVAVRASIVRSLSSIIGEEANRILLELLNDPEPIIRVIALQEIIDRVDETFTYELVERLPIEEDERVKIWLLKNLEKIGTIECFYAIESSLEDKSRHVVTQAMHSLVRLNPRDSLKILISIYESGAEFQSFLARQLKVRVEEAIEAADAEDVPVKLEDIYGYNDYIRYFKNNISDILHQFKEGKINLNSLIDDLKKYLKDDNNWEVSSAIINVLGEIMIKAGTG